MLWLLLLLLQLAHRPLLLVLVFIESGGCSVKFFLGSEERVPIRNGSLNAKGPWGPINIPDRSSPVSSIGGPPRYTQHLRVSIMAGPSPLGQIVTLCLQQMKPIMGF